MNPEAIREIYSNYDKSGSPGCAVGVLKDGKFIHQAGYGYANLDYDLPLTSKTVFDIGSTSKQFTALTMLLLEKDGKLSIDDPVRKYIAELPDYGTPLTIRHILNHTSGLRDYLALGRLEGLGADDFYTDPEVVAMIAHQRHLNFNPGEEFIYSNSGYFLVSQIVLRVAGKSMPQFLEERVFKPLGMTNTHSHDDHTMVVKNRATGYALNKGVMHVDMSTLDMIGDGGIYTTVEDLAKWDAVFYDEKSEFAPLLKRMQQPSKLTSGKTLSYGLGLFIGSWSGQPMIHHGGAWAGFRAELVRLPQQHFSVISLCNLGAINPSVHAQRVIALYYPGRMEPDPNAPRPPAPAQATSGSNPDLRNFEGTYRCDELSGPYTVKAENGKLKFRARRNDWTLAPVSDGVFASGPMRAAFTKDGFDFDFGRVKGLRFYRVAD